MKPVSKPYKKVEPPWFSEPSVLPRDVRDVGRGAGPPAPLVFLHLRAVLGYPRVTEKTAESAENQWKSVEKSIAAKVPSLAVLPHFLTVKQAL